MQDNLREVLGHLYTGYAIKNLDVETGIHYGVISGNTPSSDALDFSYSGWENATEAAFFEEITNKLLTWLNEDGEDAVEGARSIGMEHDDDLVDNLAFVFEEGPANGTSFESDDLWSVLECIEYDGMGDTWEYIDEEYHVTFNTNDNEIVVLKAPYVVQTRWCSPCFPGAGDLNSPLVTFAEMAAMAGDSFVAGQVHAVLASLEPENDYWFYCLGEDWFDEYSPCPYVPVKLSEVTK